MRFLCLVPLAALAACGGGEEEKKDTGRAQTLEAGQYEIVAEVTDFRAADAGAPKIDMPKGSRTTRSVCVSDGAKPPADLFADEGMTCREAGSSYVRNGTINTTLSCTRPDLSGDIGYSVDGSFEAQSFEANRRLTSTLTTDGDVVIVSRLQGRRTGECTPTAEGGNMAAGNEAGAAGQ